MSLFAKLNAVRRILPRLLNPDDAFRIFTLVLELKDDREFYLIELSLWTSLEGESTINDLLHVAHGLLL